MTGFGSAGHDDGEKSINVEVKSVNNRFLKTKTKLPEFLAEFEQEIEKKVKQSISRGTVTLTINYQSANAEPVCNVSYDALQAYYNMFQKVKDELGCDQDFSLDALMNLPGVIEKTKINEIDTKLLEKPLFDLISSAMEDMQQMRLRSGEDIMSEIINRGNHIKLLVKEIEKSAPEMLAVYAERLQERVSTLLKKSDIEITKDDLCKEIALYADRCDITEEVSLLTSHVEHLNETMDKGGNIGKKLEFIVQEMFREANTMGSKTNNETMLNNIFDVKTEIEKIKELVLNVE